MFLVDEDLGRSYPVKNAVKQTYIYHCNDQFYEELILHPFKLIVLIEFTLNPWSKFYFSIMSGALQFESSLMYI